MDFTPWKPGNVEVSTVWRPTVHPRPRVLGSAPVARQAVQPFGFRVSAHKKPNSGGLLSYPSRSSDPEMELVRSRIPRDADLVTLDELGSPKTGVHG